MRKLIYICEPINYIPSKSEVFETNLQYDTGQHDYENMEIAVIGTWSNWKLPGRRLEAFTYKQLGTFQKLVDKAEIVIGFNSLSFGDKLCQAHGIIINTNYDLKCEILGEVINSKLRTKYKNYYKDENILIDYSIIVEYTLEALIQANLDNNQSISHEFNSELWQKENHQKVINNCLHQVLQIKKLYDLYSKDKLFDPVYGRPVSQKFSIPVPIKSNYQKLIALGLGAFFRKDKRYAYLRKFSDYEHYIMLSRHIRHLD
jgi:hypothetical protein